MLSPCTRSMKVSSCVPSSEDGTLKTSSTFSSAVMGTPAATLPTSGTRNMCSHGFSPTSSMARGFVGSR